MPYDASSDVKIMIDEQTRSNVVSPDPINRVNEEPDDLLKVVGSVTGGLANS